MMPPGGHSLLQPSAPVASGCLYLGCCTKFFSLQQSVHWTSVTLSSYKSAAGCAPCIERLPGPFRASRPPVIPLRHHLMPRPAAHPDLGAALRGPSCCSSVRRTQASCSMHCAPSSPGGGAGRPAMHGSVCQVPIRKHLLCGAVVLVYCDGHIVMILSAAPSLQHAAHHNVELIHMIQHGHHLHLQQAHEGGSSTLLWKTPCWQCKPQAGCWRQFTAQLTWYLKQQGGAAALRAMT